MVQGVQGKHLTEYIDLEKKTFKIIVYTHLGSDFNHLFYAVTLANRKLNGFWTYAKIIASDKTKSLKIIDKFDVVISRKRIYKYFENNQTLHGTNTLDTFL